MTGATLFPELSAADLGTVNVRVVVLPRKPEADQTADDSQPLDVTEDEMLPEEGASPIASYLERPKTGRLCCVFLVNGQRQDGLDNGFIVQQLGFKYLRKRMMVIVDVDGMKPEALGDLMQGSRQGFFRGRVWEALYNRLISILKGDPELKKLEAEAEAAVSELEAGDQKVKDALDSLIDSHHHEADHVARGAGNESGFEPSNAGLGSASSVESLVSLLSPDQGQPSDYPVLVVAPPTTSLWLKPDSERSLIVASQPANAWPAMASFTYAVEPPVPELHIAEERSDANTKLTLRFTPPSDFDADDYPLRSTLHVFARFSGYKEPRQLSVALTMKPVTPPVEPQLVDEPTFLKVSTRQPVRLWSGTVDTHVRVRWNGRDELVIGASPTWQFACTCLTPEFAGLPVTFSQPRMGKFSVLIALPGNAKIGDQLRFEIVGTGPGGKTLTAPFEAIVSEKPPKTDPEPRLIMGPVPSGASRRPPYVLAYIEKGKWDSGTCWGADSWTGDDAAAYQTPTETHPLTLVINKDFSALDTYRKYLVGKKTAETEIKSRLQKYNSHVAFHLYQMYQAALQVPVADSSSDTDEDAPRALKPHEQRAEIHRVSMTLLRLMQVAR